MKDFVDLRVDQYDDNTNEGFWPSFTDIMTVIVMIFLLSMVVLQVRNMDLVKQLQSSVEAERQAASIARATAIEKHSLDEKLNDSEATLAMLRFQLQQSQQESTERLQQTRQQQQAITKLTNTQNAQALSIEQLQQLKNSLQQRLQQQHTSFNVLLKQSQILASQVQQQQQSLQLAEQSQRQKDTYIQTLLEDATQKSHVYNQLSEDHTVLQSKYEKLIKPARSSKGKIVVEVFHHKVLNQKEYKIKMPGKKNYEVVTETALHKHLTHLKQLYPEKLYIKIVFPEKSGLSYGEAWKFTNTTLVKYDSYYQEK
ncbi:MAG: hypothetical protein HOM11_08045 [Methylococcales bacterium]|jgi:hypothetical protein|nr:hypothetical protein [Methylococcales bacterium]MBT7445342.1 hypothetical protein [Methylococcales bacterium]